MGDVPDRHGLRQADWIGSGGGRAGWTWYRRRHLHHFPPCCPLMAGEGIGASDAVHLGHDAKHLGRVLLVGSIALATI